MKGVSDTIAERAAKAAAAAGCPGFTDHKKLLGLVDAVSIAVPTEYHHIVAKDFLAAGVDVLLEKPITKTLEEADELIALAAAKQLILQIGFVERFNPAIISLGQVMDGPRFIETHRLHPFFERGTDVDVVLDLMIHDLDIILKFVASPLTNLEAVGIPVLSDKVDIANVRLTFENGCVANITASRVTGKTMQKIRFFGGDGYHAVDYGKRELLSISRKKAENGQLEIRENKVEIPKHDPLEEEIKSFLASVSGRTRPVVSGEDGRRALALACRIVDKMRETKETMP
ncbi:MAG: Gfo/Idh/MocA family oxidoreductase [Smithellaceae bacterium]|nr:Gfo/Idh/MocA family oxidoreductase [Smithellaceae bacterium]